MRTRESIQKGVETRKRNDSYNHVGYCKKTKASKEKTD